MSTPINMTVARVDEDDDSLKSAPGRSVYVLARKIDPHRADDVDGSSDSAVNTFIASETKLDCYDNEELTGTPLTQPIVADWDGRFRAWTRKSHFDVYNRTDNNRPITQIGDGRLTVIVEQQDNPMNWQAAGDGVTPDDEKIVAVAEDLSDRFPGGSKCNITRPHLISSPMLPNVAGVQFTFSEDGRFILDPTTFIKANASTFFRGPANAQNITFKKVRIDGQDSLITLEEGDVNGDIILGGTDTECHTSGQSDGVVLLDGASGPLGDPQITGNPGFGTLIVPVGSNERLLRYETIVQVGTVITLGGCKLEGATLGEVVNDDDPWREHSGVKREPAINFSNGAYRCALLEDCEILNFPGQGWQINNPQECHIENLIHRGNRGIVYRRFIQDCTITRIDVECEDDCFAALGLDAVGRPSGLKIATAILRKLPPPAIDTEDAEYGGRCFLAVGISNWEADVLTYGGGSPTDIGGNKAGAQIADSDTWNTQNATLKVNNRDSNGYALQCGSLGDDPFNAEDVTIYLHGERADSRGFYMPLADGSNPKDINLIATLVECGGDRGANDLSAINITGTGIAQDAVVEGMSVNVRSIRPVRRTMQTANADIRGLDLYARIIDPHNAYASTTEASILLNRIKGGRIHVECERGDPAATGQTDYIVQANSTCDRLSWLAVHGWNGTNPVYGTAPVKDLSTNPVFAGPVKVGTHAAKGADEMPGVIYRETDTGISFIKVEDLWLPMGTGILVKAADQTITASDATNFQDLVGMVFPMEANEKFHVLAVLDLQGASTAADLLLGWTLPSGASLKANIASQADGVAVGASPNTWSTTTVGLGFNNGTFPGQAEFYITNGATPGNAQLKAHQNTSTAEVDKVLAGSHLRITKL